MTVSRLAVIGDGVIGLATAFVAAERGLHVTLYAPALAGAASPASAGMLAPSIERTDGAAQTFGDDSRAAWPRLAGRLAAAGAEPFEIRRQGILHIARTDADAERLHARLRGNDTWLDAAAVRALEPHIAPDIRGAARFPNDGVVDAPGAVTSLRHAAETHARISIRRSPVESLACNSPTIGVRSADGTTQRFDHVVLAAGAWSAGLHGLPRPLPIHPLRGALVAVNAPLVTEPMYGPDGHTYLLPRHGRTIIGATSDAAGFDHATGPTDAERLLDAAAQLIPAVREAPALAPWAGLRPMTPDGRPILGPDPAVPNLIYACGHGRNGFLHAALTAEVVTELVVGGAVRELGVFYVERF